MNRRSFAKLAASSLAFSPAGSLAQPGSQRAGRMKLATQHDSSDGVLRVMAALGTIDAGALPPAGFRFDQTVDSPSGRGPLASDFLPVV